MANGFEYPKEIDGHEFPPFIIGRFEYFRPAQNGKVANGCRLVVCQEHENAEKRIYRQWSYEGETEPRNWHDFGPEPKTRTLEQVLDVMHIETMDWKLRKKPWDTEAKPRPESPDPPHNTVDDGPNYDLPPLDDTDAPPTRSKKPPIDWSKPIEPKKPVKPSPGKKLLPPAKQKPGRAVPKKPVKPTKQQAAVTDEELW